MMAVIMVAMITAATNLEVLVCVRHCLRKYSCIIIIIIPALLLFSEGGYTVRHAGS